MDPRLEAALAAALGCGVGPSRALSGGDINEAYEVALEDGRRDFREDERALAARHVRGGGPWAGLAGRGWRAAYPARARGVAAAEEPAFLALELLATGRPARDFDERLGQGLAELHRQGAPGFGLDHDNFIGRLPQRTMASERHLGRVLSVATARAAASARGGRGARLFADARVGSIDCSRRCLTSSVRRSCRRGSTATSGAATSSATTRVRPVSSTRRFTAVTAKSTWR